MKDVKLAARYLMARAIAKGELKRKKCEVCGSRARINGHHEDYEKPLQVNWLCPLHHAARHAYVRWKRIWDEPCKPFKEWKQLQRRLDKHLQEVEIRLSAMRQEALEENAI